MGDDDVFRPPRRNRLAWARPRTMTSVVAIVFSLVCAQSGITAMRANVHAAAGAAGGGVVLDSWGGIHPFGGMTMNAAGMAYWQGWDIARAVAIRDDGSGGWTLDGWGGVHPFGVAGSVAIPAYWPGWDIARDLVITSRDAAGVADGRQGYVLDGWGGVHAFGGAPALPLPWYSPGKDLARGLAIHYDSARVPDGLWVLLADGTIAASGRAPAIRLTDEHVPSTWLHLRGNGDGTLFAVSKWAVTAAVTGLPETTWTGMPDWGGEDAVRDLVLSSASTGQAAEPLSAGAVAAYRNAYRPAGGVTLDGWGGLHQFGGYALNGAGAPYWPEWDIARQLVLMEDGSGGWELEGWGGVHPFGSAAPVSRSVYWPGWDIARALVITSHDAHGNLDGRQGYILDGWGGVHPFGGAPALPTPAYWSGWDIARGLDVHLDAGGVPDGLLLLDGWGGLHVNGNYPVPARATVYHPGHDVYQGLQRTSDGNLFAVTRFGVTQWLGGQNISTSPWATGGPFSPSWSGYSDWGRWDILRDISLGSSENPQVQPQPVSFLADDELQNRVTDIVATSLPVPAIHMDKPLDCESAATSAALAGVGAPASQDSIFAALPVDTRPAQVSGGRVIHWGDPYADFVGNVYGSEPSYTGYGVYFPPIAAAAQGTGRSSVGDQGWTISDLLAEVVRGHPAVVWTLTTYSGSSATSYVAFDGRTVPFDVGEHAVVLYGVDPQAGTVAIMDDATGTYRTFTWGQFATWMTTFLDMAVVVE